MTAAEHALAVVGGVAVGLVLAAPILYGLYRFDKWGNDRKRAIKAAERLAAMHRHPASGQVVASEVEFETTSPKFRRAS
jgi:hypothetical protein